MTADGRGLNRRVRSRLNAAGFTDRSGIAAKEVILRVHLVPALGDKKLHAIKSEDVQHLKSALSRKATKTVNNILTVLNVLLKKAVEWEVIERVPYTIRVLPVLKGSTHFYDYEFERLVAAARATDPRAYVRADGGRSRSAAWEMVALMWGDIDFVKRRSASNDRRGRTRWRHRRVADSGTSR